MDPIECVETRDVMRLTGMSRTTLWRRIKTRDFPQPLPRSKPLRWRKGAILDWMLAWERASAAEDARIAKLSEI